MKIIQINAWLGQIFGALARLIAAEKPDIVCLQEAFRPNPEIIPVFAPQFNFIDRLRKAGNFSHLSFAPNWGFQIGDAVMDQGLCILSRHPLDEEQNVHIHQKYHVRRTCSDSLSNTRNFQSCRVTLPAGPTLYLANYQGYLDGPNGLGTEVTVSTLKKVGELLSRLPKPIIFCTDLNIWPGSPAMQVMNELNLRNLSVEYAVSSTLSDAHCAPDQDRARAVPDYIFISADVEVKSFAVSQKIVSDHKALILEFELC